MLTASGPGGINEIQYAALLMMIARHTGYKPGKFSHIVANE
jgi:thymidylate synthase